MTLDQGRRFRHRLVLDLVRLFEGKAVWRPRCSCGWRSAIKVDDADAAVTMALAHTGGYVFGHGQSRDSLLAGE